MILTPKLLLTLLSIESLFAASVPKGKKIGRESLASEDNSKAELKDIPQSPSDFVNDRTKGITRATERKTSLTLQDSAAFKPFDDMEEKILEEEQLLRQSLKNTEMEEFVNAVNGKIAMIIEDDLEYGNAFAAALLGRFEDIQREMINIALKKNMLHLLRTFATFDYLESNEHFIILKIISFGKDWFDNKAFNRLEVDWSEKLGLIFQADNPKFFNALQNKRIATLYTIDLKKIQQSLSNQICKYDSIEICKSLDVSIRRELGQKVELLLKCGAIKILKFLAEEGPLQLRERYFSTIYPFQIEDFEFLRKQGLSSRSQVEELTAACVNGSMSVLTIMCKEDDPVKPSFKDLNLAAEYGHLEVLKFAKKLGLEFVIDYHTITRTISNGNVKVLEFLVNEYKVEIDQWMLNYAYSQRQLGMVRWIHEHLKNPKVPNVDTLSKTSVGIIKFVQQVNPSKIDVRLVKIADTAILKYLWKDEKRRKAMEMEMEMEVQTLFTKDLKWARDRSIDSDEKMWCVYDIWGELPTLIDWNASVDTLEDLEKKFDEKPMPITQKTMDEAFRARNLQTLIWIYKYYHRKTLPKKTLDYAVKRTLGCAVRIQDLAHADCFRGLLGNMEKEKSVVENALQSIEGDGFQVNEDTLYWARKNYQIDPTIDHRYQVPSNNLRNTFEWMVLMFVNMQSS